MRTVLAYSAARLMIFVATAGVLYLVGARGLLLLGVAVLISGIVSYVVLSTQRDAMSSSVTSVFTRTRDKIREAQTKEDPKSGPEPGPRPGPRPGRASSGGSRST